LPYFLSSLKEQTFKEYNILVFDNTEDEKNENLDFILENYPEIETVRAGENLGYAKAYNIIIDKAIANGAEYFLALNPDMKLEPDAVEKLFCAIKNDESLGSVCPKILKWDFKNNSLNQSKSIPVIDSCGIILKSGLRFIDLGQNEIDSGQHDNKDILGPSGAAALFRISALQKSAENGKYFDEMMFMYKEDCDLAYRLNLAGYKSRLVPDSIIYHDRTTSGKGDGNISVALNRKNKSKQVKEWSYLNQLIIFYKFWNVQNFKEQFFIFYWLLKSFIFALLFERYLLNVISKFYFIKTKIKQFKSV
jgi:GT2 family glycosyltransferase